MIRKNIAKREPDHRRVQTRLIRLRARSAALLAAAGLACGAALPGKTLRACEDVKDPLTLDPHRQFSEKNHTIVQQIFEGLVRFGPDGEIEPALAVSWERTGPRRMRFHLREGVRFHNGEPFDAEAVRFTVERYLAPETAFPAIGYVSSLERVEIIDKKTVDLVTREPDGLLLNRLAGFVVIVPPGHYASTPPERLHDRPVGTGPFAFESWERGDRVVLRRNPDYWDPRYPLIDRLVFSFIPMDRQVDALLAGKVDIVTSLQGTRTLEVQRSSSTKVLKKPTLYTMAANFNTRRPPLNDVRVRRAINHAVDRSDLIRYDLHGNGIAIGTLSLDGETGHDDSLPPYAFDPKLSKKLLRDAGFSGGFRLKVLLKVNAERTGRILAKQLSRVGIGLDFTRVTDAELFEKLRDRKAWDMAIYSCPDPMHHAYFIRSIFLGGESPFSLSREPAIDERTARMERTLDPARQAELSRELDRFIYEGHFALPTYQRVGVAGVRAGVRYTPYASGMPYFFAAGREDEL